MVLILDDTKKTFQSIYRSNTDILYMLLFSVIHSKWYFNQDYCNVLNRAYHIFEKLSFLKIYLE